MNAVETRDEALELINNLRSELAEFHWYAHQFVMGKAGIDRDGVLVQFGNAASEMGMALNFLTERVDQLCRLTVASGAAK